MLCSNFWARIFGFLILLGFVVIFTNSQELDATSAEISSKKIDNNKELNLQSIRWEQELIFYEVLEWAKDGGLLTTEQHIFILDELNRKLEVLEDGTASVASRRIYGFISARFTVSALVYGTLLVLVFLSMLVAVILTWDFFQGGALFLVSLAYIFFFLWVGGHLWDHVQWNILGGLFYAFAIATTPVAVHSLLRVLGILQDCGNVASNPSGIGAFITIEVVTIVFGFVLMYHIHFSFLITPILTAIWFFLVHVTSIIVGYEISTLDAFRKLSIVYGLFLAIVAFCLEAPDSFYSFWIYIFGCMALSIGMTQLLSVERPSLDGIYLILHIGLICFATSYHRILLLIFGAFGILVYFIHYLKVSRHTTPSLPSLANCSITSMVLLSISNTRYSPNTQNGLVEFVYSVLLMVLYNISWVRHVFGTSPAYKSISLFIHAMSQIILVFISYNVVDVKYCPYAFQLDGKYILCILGCIGLILNYVTCTILDLNLNVHQVCPARVPLVLSIGFLSFIIPTRVFAVSSIISLLIISWVALVYNQPDFRKTPLLVLAHWIITIVSYTLTQCLKIDYLGWITLIANLYITNIIWASWHRLVPFYVLGYFITGLFFHSITLILVGTMILELWLLYYIREHWRRKRMVKSIGVVFMLIFLSLCLLSSSVKCPNRFSQYLLENVLVIKLFNPVDKYFKLGNAILYEQSTYLGQGLLFTFGSPLSFASMLLKDVHYAFSVLFFSVLVTIISEISTSILKEIPIDGGSPAKVTIKRITIHFPRDTDQNGIVIGFFATKPIDFMAHSASLYIDGKKFRDGLCGIYGQQIVNVYYKDMIPLSLFPNRISKHSINKKQSDVEFYLHWGTGQKGEPKIAQSHIRSSLRKLVSYGDPVIILRAVYTSKTAIPRRATLFETQLNASQILNSIREGLSLKSLLKVW